MNELLKKRQESICSNLDQIAPMVLTDANGIVLAANSKFCILFGSAIESVLGRDIRACLSETYSSVPIGPTNKLEVEFVSKSGFAFWLELSIFSIAIDPGRNGYLWLGFDVTERKSTEQFLAESQLFSKSLMQTAPVGIFVTNSIGGCTYVNGYWSRQSGITGAKAKGNGWQSLLHPDDKDSVVRDWTAFVQNKGSFSNKQYRYLHPNGTETCIQSSAISLGNADAVSGFLRIEQDITERLQNEKIIREQQQVMVASSKMSALGEMAGGVAHEINNPLAAIKSLSGQLQELLEETPLDISLIKEMAAKVEKTTSRIAKIVSGLRSFSRDGGKDPYQTVNVHQLIEETLSFCGERFKNNGTTITVEKFRKDLSFEGRSTEVSQVLLNLFNNAFDAIAGLKEKWIRVSVVEKNDTLEIQVTDSGSGVPPEVREKIFQPFFTTKEIGKGTGMGLSISAGIIQSHNGQLKLDASSTNTRFSIILPIRQQSVKAA